ncbi:MAG: iron transporter [Magnetococcales bacterium]|nr:iron transporter [Magnetococcales bacterium]MBF0439987.1 iron transporter [Magnetococcales bacterium]
MRNTFKYGVVLAGFYLFTPAISTAAVMEIGKVDKNGMKVSAIYIQTVVMEGHDHHAGHGDHAKHDAAPANTERGGTDIHLEAQIHAQEKNPHGFSAGSWIPYLNIEYTLEKVGSDWKAKGVLIPMASSDGPHYGENVKLAGPGKYKVVYQIKPPSIPYHVDKETGVKGWWEPFTQDWEFNYTGTGKKGGY